MSITKTITRYGAVTGISGNNQNYSVFKGIPYAKPPVGELRFAPPQLPERWEGERVCNRFSVDCIQVMRPGMYANPSEDCLYLNIYTPASSTEEKLPVMFWIYGGGFGGGRATDPEFDGEAVCKRDVILVTFNYRCGAMGFFALPELNEKNGYSGNVGLLDQIAALKWVRENIAAFGGDADRIMVHGQSAGGISSRILLTSPLSRSMFSRTAIQSGGGLNEADLMRPKQDFIHMCQESVKYLGWTLKDLYEMDAMEMNEQLSTAVRQVVGGNEVGFFQPFIDGHVIVDVPGNCISRGDYADIAIICGSVAGDAWMFSRKVIDQLGDNEEISRGFALSPGQAWARNQVKKGQPPIYVYYMDRTQPPKEDKNRPMNHKPHYGHWTPHSTEIAYVFGTLNKRGNGWSEYDHQLSNAMTDYWTNFAKTGNPNGEGLPEWPLYKVDMQYTMHFGDQGYQAENVVLSAHEEKVIDYIEMHPGMLVSLGHA